MKTIKNLLFLCALAGAAGCPGPGDDGMGGAGGDGTGGSGGDGTGGSGGAPAECDSTGDGDATCAAANPSTPVCADGVCVECADHDRCVSEVCDRDASTCVPVEQVVYVANGGFLGDEESGEDMPGCGVPQSKCLTVRYAVDNRLDEELGRTWVKVADGQYRDRIEIANQTVQLIGGNDVRLGTPQGAGPNQAMVDIAESANVLIDQMRIIALGEGSSVVGCAGEFRQPSSVKIHRSSASQASGVAIYIRNDCSGEIVDSVVSNNDSDGIWRRTSGNQSTDALVVRGSVIENNDGVAIVAENGSVEIQQSLISENGGGGIRIQNSSFLIRNNFIQNNGEAFSATTSTLGGVVIEIDGPDLRIFEFNTVVGNEIEPNQNKSPGIACETVAPVEIKNNIVWGNEGGNSGAVDPDAQVSGFCDVSYSNVQGGLTQEFQLIIGPGNIDTDPLFVDPFRGDYRIQAESLAKDAADPEATVDVDFDSNPRPVGGAHDMGAHEVQ